MIQSEEVIGIAFGTIIALVLYNVIGKQKTVIYEKQ
jgi:hypothetical protein